MKMKTYTIDDITAYDHWVTELFNGREALTAVEILQTDIPFGDRMRALRELRAVAPDQWARWARVCVDQLDFSLRVGARSLQVGARAQTVVDWATEWATEARAVADAMGTAEWAAEWAAARTEEWVAAAMSAEWVAHAAAVATEAAAGPAARDAARVRQRDQLVLLLEEDNIFDAL